VVDRKKEFHSCAAAAFRVDLDRTLLIQPSTERDVLWSLEQALRCPGVVATLGWVGETRERVFRRLQLAAETGGGLGMLLRPQSASREPCWADLRFSVEPIPLHESRPGRRVRVRLLYGRAGRAGRECELCIHDEASDLVRVASPLAAPKAAASKARA
jgi:hypothetical protein